MLVPAVRITRSLLPLFALLGTCISSAAEEPVAKSRHLWMGPPGMENGRCIRELFEHPEQWAEARSSIEGLLYTDLQFDKQFKDEELQRWLPRLSEWGLHLQLETGVIKEWSKSGEKTFNIERRIWDRLQKLGGKIHSIAMDEPLLAVREHLHLPDDLALQETANYIALVRQNYPAIQIGDIETYPSLAAADHVQWIDSLNKLLAEKKVRGLDFYRLDVNWAVFNVLNKGSWREVRQIEQECRKRKLPFSLIYWPSCYPGLRKRGLGDDTAWYVQLMEQGYDYTMVDGRPDEFVIESWVQAPAKCIPETEDFTFTRSVRDFARRFTNKGT